jgi:protein-tyrosine-phosphatase
MGRNSTSALSAGFLAPDRPSPPEARTVALRRGVTLEAHRSRRVGERPWAGIDLVAVMNGSQAWRLVREHGFPASRIIILGDLDTLPITSREIPDPGGQGEAVFEETFDRIDRCLGVLYATLW